VYVLLYKLGGVNIKTDIKRKILVVACVTLFIGTILIPVSAQQTQKQQNNKIKFLEKETTKIRILDSSSDKLVITEKALSSNQVEHIIKAFFETEMKAESYYQQSKEKIKILQENELISSETANTLLKRFDLYKKFYEFRTKQAPEPAAADVGAILNLIIFGIKGAKDVALLELNFPPLDFFNGTIAGRFCLLGQWAGKGFIFSLGILGFKNIYEFDQQLYPEFPHMPDIKGTNLVFIGILIDIISENPDTLGHYFLGLGTTLLTVWNKT